MLLWQAITHWFISLRGQNDFHATPAVRSLVVLLTV